MQEFQNSRIEIFQKSKYPEFLIGVLEVWNIPDLLLFLVQVFPWRNSGIFQNSYYSWARIPGEEFWNIPEFLLSLDQDSRIPTILGPGLLGRNSGIFRNSYYSWARIPGCALQFVPPLCCLHG